MYEPNNETIQSVIISQDMTEQFEQLSLIINDDALGVTISPWNVFCQKTGHIVGTRDQNSLFSLIKNSGKNAIIPALYNSPGFNVHPLWIYTNGKNLDQHIDNDPIGYAVYCFGIITSEFYQNVKNSDKKRKPWCERYWAIARANALLTSRGVAEISELNTMLCKVITFMPDSTAYLFRRIRKFAQTPDALAMLHCTGELIGMLKEATNRALDSIGRADDFIQRTRFVDYAASPADMARGPSNVRAQRRSRIDIEEESNFSALAALFKKAGIEDELRRQTTAHVPGTGAWIEKYKTRAQLREAAIAEGLSALSNINFDDVEADNDADDNEVEIRTLAIDSAGYVGTVQVGTEPPRMQIGIDCAIPMETITEISTVQELEIVKEDLHIVPVMAEIAKQVLENVEPCELDYNVTGIVLSIRDATPEETKQIVDEMLANKKPMSALEKLRAKKGV